jgi:nucleotide-binding universal stress UspA family protein
MIMKGEMTMGLEYHNILVAVDGSKESEFAFKKAIEIAKKNDAKLLLAHVIDTRTYAYAGVEIEPFERNIADRGEMFAADMLEKYKETALKEGITNIDTVIEFGSPKITIPKEIAKKYNCDLIICGATGLNAVERFLMGSVSEAITRHASCDVLIVRREKEEA